MLYAAEKRTIDRRGVILLAIGSAPLLAGMTRPAEAETKVPQSAVHYQSSAKNGHDCQHCYHFEAPHTCKLVDGDIVPSGWCALWVNKLA